MTILVRTLRSLVARRTRGLVLWGTLCACIGATAVATAGSVNPLRGMVRVYFPDHLITVGDAAQYLVEIHGYTLIVTHPAPADSAAIAAAPIPVMNNANRVVATEDALLELVGKHNAVVIDHTHKLVSFTRYTGNGVRL